MRLPQFRIQSLLIGVALVAAVVTATIEIERAPFLSVAIYVFVPAITIGLWQRLGLGGMLVEVVPAYVALFGAWAMQDTQIAFGLPLAFVAGILAALLLWYLLTAAPGASRAISQAALWGIISMLCSIALFVISVLGIGLIS
jgi:hypothetical protein